jgi:(2R)-ethylmalonyl-CoA mutase
MDLLREAGLADVPVVVGGIVPPGDDSLLLQAGVRRVFHPGSRLDEIAAAVLQLVRERQEGPEARG